MLTAKGKYALKALIYLSSLEPGEKAQGLAIAKAGNVPKKFLDAILGELRTAGVVFTKKGPGGGYMLARAASDIKVGHVVRAIDGPLAPIRCVSQTAYEPCTCPDEAHCGLRMLMLDVRNAIADILDRYTLADVVEITLRKMRRDSVSLPFSPLGATGAVQARLPARIAREQLTRRGRAPKRGRASPSEGVLHHILGEYSI